MTDVAHDQDLQAVNTDNLESELAGLPEKFKGKTLSDIASAYLELEKEKSRIANELGESRRTITSLLEVKPKEVEKKERPVVNTDELLSDPNTTIDQAIDTHPAVQKARETAENLERQIAQKTFESEYPTYKDDLKDDAFVDWVKKNPVRQYLIQQANSYDLNSARALWDMWKEHKELVGVKATQAADQAKRKEAEKNGTLEGSSGADASSEVTLNRAELRELQRKALLGDKAALAKWNDPKFRQMRISAYADGRVE